MDDNLKRLIELGLNASPAIAELKKLGDETQKQTSSLDGLQSQLTNFGNQIKGAFVGLGVKEAIGDVISGIKGMIDEFDHLTDAAQAIGVTVESVQELQYALALGGNMTSSEANAVLVRFNDKLAEINDTTSNTSRVLREMGITANDTVEDALAKLADVFAKAPDGIDKTALAVELFGRNLGTKMVAALNSGAQGIADLRKELNDLNGVIDGDTAEAAAKFNDDLDKLKISSSALGRTIVKDLLPELTNLTQAFVNAAKEGNIWATMMQRLDENNQDRRLMIKRWFGFGEGEKLHSEQRAAAAEWDNLAASMEKARQASARMSGDGVPKVAKPPKPEKTGGRTKSVKEEVSDLEKWWQALMKAQGAIDDTPQKIERLEGALAELALSGDTSSKKWEAFQAELLKLRPDPVVTALKKLNDEAKKLAENPAIIAAIEAELTVLENGGEGNAERIKLFNAELLKMKAAAGDNVAAVTIQLEALRKTTEANNAQTEIWFDLLARGKVTAEEFAQGVAKVLPDVQDAVKKTTEDVFDLSKAISDASSKFVTDWVDEMIDGFGKTSKGFDEMILDMIKALAKLIAQAQIAKAFASSSSGGGGWGDIINGIFKTSATYGQGTMSGGGGPVLSSPQFFARTSVGVASNASVYSAPSAQQGGEGGASAGSGGTVINVHNNAPTEVATVSRDNDDGTKQIDIYIERKVKKMMNDGTMDRTMRSTYGMTRQPAAG